MKNIFLVALSLILIFVLFAGCSINRDYEEYTYTTTKYTYSTRTTTTTKRTTTTTASWENVQWINNRAAHYYEDEGEYIIFFGLLTEEEEFTYASGNASIDIYDNNDNLLYSKVLPFSKDDFSTWTNDSWNEDRYLCGLHIKQWELQQGTSNYGYVTLGVTLSNGGGSFEKSNFTISKLPTKTTTKKTTTTTSAKMSKEEKNVVVDSVELAIESLKTAMNAFQDAQADDIMPDIYMQTADLFLKEAKTTLDGATTIASIYPNLKLSDGSKLYDRLKAAKQDASLLSINMTIERFEYLISDVEDIRKMLDNI